jgi:hypothetical protein
MLGFLIRSQETEHRSLQLAYSQLYGLSSCKTSTVGLLLHSFEEKHPGELLETILPFVYVAVHV